MAACAAASQSMLSASSCCAFPSKRIHRRPYRPISGSRCRLFTVHASSDESDCNTEECAPDKEVGKVSMEWLAGEKTKIVGTYPPGKKGWTGYVEKDTAGQTNIYSVEPTVYVAESVISSGSAGMSAEGSENTAAIFGGLALISIAAASSILIQVGKNPQQTQTSDYSGPPLSYYISKFKPVSTIEVSVAPEPQSSTTVEASAPPASETSSTTVEASIPSEPQVPTEVQSENEASTASGMQL